MAEGNKTGVAEQQIEAHGEQRQDDDIGGHEGIKTRAEKRHHQGGEEDQQGPGHTSHLRGRPSRPHGRTIRMAAIRTDTAKIEKRGKIKMPKDRTWP